MSLSRSDIDKLVPSIRQARPDNSLKAIDAKLTILVMNGVWLMVGALLWIGLVVVLEDAMVLRLAAMMLIIQVLLNFIRLMGRGNVLHGS